jgi:hypothetical protein
LNYRNISFKKIYLRKKDKFYSNCLNTDSKKQKTVPSGMFEKPQEKVENYWILRKNCGK